MARHFYFRYDGNAARFGIGYNGPCFVLGIVTTVGIGIAFRAVSPAMVPPVFPVALCSPGGLFGKRWIFFYFQSPARAIGKVPVEGVHFIKRHQVQEAFDLGGIAKMAGYVEMDAPVGKAWLVNNQRAG